MRSSVSLVTGVLVLVVMVAMGCGKSAAPAKAHPVPPSPVVSSAAAGEPGGRIVVAFDQPPRTFNPLFAFDSASDAACRLVHGSLVKMDWATQEIGPGLAESWTVAPDERTWTFKLRQGLRWSDGAPLTATDVVFTWVRLMYEPAFNPGTYEVFRLGGKSFQVTRVDDLTVRVVTPEVWAPFLEFFGTVAILPKHILEKTANSKQFPAAYTGGASGPVVGCGPFRVKSVQPGGGTLLERNPEYWVVDKLGRRLPYLDEVQLLPAQAVDGVKSESAKPVLALLIAGKYDICDNIRLEDCEQVGRAVTNANLQLIELGPGGENDLFWFNQNTGCDPAAKPFVDAAKLKLFRDRKFRQAVSCAIDRDRIAREVYAGRAKPAFSFVAAETGKWSNPAVPRFAHDVSRARALFADAGLKARADGVLEISDKRPLEIRLSYNTGNTAREKAAAIIQDNLQAVGVNLRLEPVEFRVLLEKVNQTFDYECALLGLGGGAADPASQMNVLHSREELHQWFPRQQTPSTEWEARVDSLMAEQVATLNVVRRKAAFHEVQAILAEELPMISTVSPYCYGAVKKEIGNVRPSPFTPYRLTWNLEELYVRRK